MRAGLLRNLVSIQQQDAGVDSVGQATVGWSELAKDWADVRVQGGLEMIRANAETAIAKASIRLRYRMDIKPGMRVVFDGFTFKVLSANPDIAGRNFIDLVCESIT
jgi:SPP1 family predicted phage head-tail adaptor